MSIQGYYLISIWAVQFALYAVVALRLVRWKINKRMIFWIAVGLFLVAPWLFPVNGRTEDGRYVCGMMVMMPYVLFWMVGIFGNLVLKWSFAGLGAELSRRSKEQ